jgi:hypothetical protein
MILSPAEKLANEVRHLTAAIPRVADLPATVTMERRPSRKRLEEGKFVMIGRARVSHKAANMRRLRAIEVISESLHRRLEKFDNEIRGLREKLEIEP